jgi:hypothetical protein
MHSLRRPLICLANLNCYLLATVVLTSVGCKPADSTVALQSQPADSGADAPGHLVSDDYWDVIYMQGSKVAHSHTTISPAADEPKNLLRIEAINKLSVMRFGERTQQELRTISFETPAGEVVRWETHSSLGAQPVVVKGTVEGSRMLIHSSDGSPDQAIAWPADARGFGGVEQSLTAKPMLPGERRTLKLLLPMLNQVVSADLTAGAVEDVKMLVGSQKLLRIDSVLRLAAGNELTSVLWTDTRGRALKTKMDAMQQETFRTTADVAQAPDDGKGFDLGADAIVRIEPPLVDPHGSKTIVYEIELDGGNPAEVFAQGPTQQVDSLGPHRAKLTVLSVRPQSSADAKASVAEKASPESTPVPTKEKTAEYLTPNSIVQSDDPLVVKLSGSVAAGEPDAWKVAVSLEKLVHDSISKKNFSQALATASQVAASLEGDCTEHAVLLAALARARGIPARVAIGLVYIPGLQGFGYHMWTEVAIDGVWIPLDATLGQAGIGAAHLKLGDSSLQGASSFSSFLPVAQVLGRLKVKVVSAE